MEVAPVEGLNVAFDRSTGLCSVREDHPITADISIPLSYREDSKSGLKNPHRFASWLSVALAMSIMITVAIAIFAGVESSRCHAQSPKGKLKALALSDQWSLCST